VTGLLVDDSAAPVGSDDEVARAVLAADQVEHRQDDRQDDPLLDTDG
jgi:hypothetical protein